MAKSDSTPSTVSRRVTIGGTAYTIHGTAGDLAELRFFGSQLLELTEHIAASLGREELSNGMPDALWATLRTARSLFGVRSDD